MKLGVDTNVLVYTHIGGLPHHPPVRRFMESRAAMQGTVLCLTPRVLNEFVHIVTDPRRFDAPLTVDQALQVARGYGGRSNVQILAENEESMVLAWELMQTHRLGRNRLADTFIAATLLSAGVTDLVTCNVDDFRIFEALTLHDPLRRGVQDD